MKKIIFITLNLILCLTIAEAQQKKSSIIKLEGLRLAPKQLNYHAASKNDHNIIILSFQINNPREAEEAQISIKNKNNNEVIVSESIYFSLVNNELIYIYQGREHFLRKNTVVIHLDIKKNNYEDVSADVFCLDRQKLESNKLFF